MSSTEAYPFSFKKASTPEFMGGNRVRAPHDAPEEAEIFPVFQEVAHHFSGESVVAVGRQVVLATGEYVYLCGQKQDYAARFECFEPVFVHLFGSFKAIGRIKQMDA